MKTSNFILFLLPAAYAAKGQLESPVIDATPSLPNVTPPTPLPALQSPGGSMGQLDAHQLAQVAIVQPSQADPQADPADAAIATAVPNQGTMGLGTLTGSRGATKTHQVRSEGTLGQTPWIGMAIGLTCTTLAAVMLG